MRLRSNIFAAFLIACASISCYQDEVLNGTPQDPETGVFGDQLKVRLNVQAPNPFVVETKAVDPDGKDIHSLTVFCFDENGIFISTSNADLQNLSVNEEGDNTSGVFDVIIPRNTRVMHLAGNLNMSMYKDDPFSMKSEDEVISILEGGAGMLIYWARIQIPDNVITAQDIVTWLTVETNPTDKVYNAENGKNNPIILLRNQAKFTIVSSGWETKELGEGETRNEWNGAHFEVTGYAVCNTPAYGTIAPYHSSKGYPTYTSSTFIPSYSVPDWVANPIVSSPARSEKMSDIMDVTTTREQYIFETYNKSTDPVDLILRGYNIDENGKSEVERYYYRVNILDADGELIDIFRNHHYQINIMGNLTNGVSTFQEALVAPPTNNIWLSVSDEVKSVMNNEYQLTVEETKVVVDADDEEDMMSRQLSLNFSVKQLGTEAIDPNKLTISWVEDDQKVSSTFNPSLVIGNAVTFQQVGDTYMGVISIQLNRLAQNEQFLKGTLLVKYGHLQRSISVVLVRTQKFVPAWVSSEVYGTVTGDTESREEVTVVFTIPENCPEELFPFDVLITSNGLDGRAESGQVLPVVRKGEDGYGDTFNDVIDGTTISDLGYKYVFTVTEPGQKRVYFENILSVPDGAVDYVTLEAEHFERLSKPITYVDHHNTLVLPGLSTYTAIPGASESEMISYLLVPQKRFAEVIFDIAPLMGTGDNTTSIANDEFLLYSSNLDHYTDDDARLSDDYKNSFDCYFKPYAEAEWGTGGRIFGFYPREAKVNGGTFWETKAFGGTDYKVFQIYMETNKPDCAEIVRVASNQENSTSVKFSMLDYTGNTYRSVTFELANYRPFRFAAQVNGQGSYKDDSSLEMGATPEPEDVDQILIPYGPNKEVEISFDVTSFSTRDVSVDPFGFGFEVFISTPMFNYRSGDNPTYLRTGSVGIVDVNEDGSKPLTSKKAFENLRNGNFVYRVNGNRTLEAEEWKIIQGMPSYSSYNITPLIVDSNIGAAAQAGDRKTITFRTSSIVTNGEIVISSNPEHVTYHTKVFKISNAPIQGRIGYKPEGAQDPIPVPAAQFVSFTRVSDGSRIGSMVVKSTNELTPDAPTYYELRLRQEYDFEWEDDPIKVQCQVGGIYYSAILPDIKTLCEGNTTIELVPETE